MDHLMSIQEYESSSCNKYANNTENGNKDFINGISLLPEILFNIAYMFRECSGIRKFDEQILK